MKDGIKGRWKTTVNSRREVYTKGLPYTISREGFTRHPCTLNEGVIYSGTGGWEPLLKREGSVLIGRTGMAILRKEGTDEGEGENSL